MGIICRILSSLWTIDPNWMFLTPLSWPDQLVAPFPFSQISSDWSLGCSRWTPVHLGQQWALLPKSWFWINPSASHESHGGYQTVGCDTQNLKPRELLILVQELNDWFDLVYHTKYKFPTGLTYHFRWAKVQIYWQSIRPRLVHFVRERSAHHPFLFCPVRIINPQIAQAESVLLANSLQPVENLVLVAVIQPKAAARAKDLRCFPGGRFAHPNKVIFFSQE